MAFNEFEHGPEKPGDHDAEESPYACAQEGHDQQGTEAYGNLDPEDLVPGLTQVGSDGLPNGSGPAASIEREEKIEGPRYGQGEYGAHRSTDGDLRSVPERAAPGFHELITVCF